ncbi:MAG TPA: cellulase family glycosylhydrolase [Umezawaea sp.]|nr:cellulase family glycosylhydrolase [Umezawaea sp.]
MRLIVVLLAVLLVPVPVAGAVVDDTAVHVRAGKFRDDQGREVTLRGFTVSGTAKLAENRGLPFATTADASRSARAMKQLTGANSARFPITWAWVEPEPGRIDHAYLDRVTEQISAFTDEGILVYLDFHQDLYSRYLFNADSWYTGDGAPAWVVRAGGYPRESCGLCVHWGQNMKSNRAVTDATYDFWHNREITTSAGPRKIRDAFLNQAGETLRHLKANLSASAFRLVLGVDPINEPYAGRYDGGQTSLTWERDLLWPFYQRFRAVMDTEGWGNKAAFVEPLVFWNQNVESFAEPGGLTEVPGLGDRYVFNSHFYDGKAQSGILKPGKANDGEYAADFRRIADRATALGTTSIVSEFGHPIAGYTSDKTPTILKAIHQSLDSRLSGADWWARPASSGPALSGSQWHWDVNYGRHHELMNDNPNKVKTDGDAMNDEHFSAVRLDDAGTPLLTVDSRLVDRLYPLAVAGDTVAFTYEDLARDGSTTLSWNRVPTTMPAVRALVGSGQYGVLVWRSTSGAPTELHLPRSFQTTTVVSDAEATVVGDRLLLNGSDGLHHALIAGTASSPEQRAAAAVELRDWVGRTNP